ncbi:MAG: tetratricopeptide repeat protein [Deltaproteobacteria bacterium]|nr:tetratricopeptide repeat protein [Deltaproteobacteria bacterium]
MKHATTTRTVGTLLAAVALSATACSRDHIEAINLANLGDKSLSVNVEGAIQKYEEASRLDPTSHRIFAKLANAYQKKEDWDKMASTLSRAMQIAPEFASYAYRRGYALMQKAVAAGPEGYEEAKQPLQKCIETDPNYAECYHELGTAMLWTDNEQGALENWTKAIEHDPTVPYFYDPLAASLIALKLYDQADAVLKEGTRIILPKDEATKNALYNMYVLRSMVSQARGDKSEMVSALERANEVGGDAHPEIGFNLGSTYAVANPPQKEKALRLLNSFVKRTCKGAQAAEKFKDQCATSADLVQKLGGTQ